MVEYYKMIAFLKLKQIIVMVTNVDNVIITELNFEIQYQFLIVIIFKNCSVLSMALAQLNTT